MPDHFPVLHRLPVFRIEYAAFTIAEPPVARIRAMVSVVHQGAGRLHGRDTDAGYEILIGTSLCNRLTDDLYGLMMARSAVGCGENTIAFPDLIAISDL